MNAKGSIRKNLPAFIAALGVSLFNVAIHAHSSVEWQSVQSSGKDFSATIPGKFLVNNENDRTLIVANTGFLNISIVKQKNVFGKDYSLTIKAPETENFSAQQFKVGKFVGQRHIYSTPKVYSVSIYASSSQSYYSINASTKMTNDPNLKRFLSSIKLGGENLFTIEGNVSPPDSPGLVIDNLESSPIVREFLKKPKNKNVVVKFERIIKKTAPDSDDLPKQNSRNVIILRKPRVTYTDSARHSNLSGSIRARVKLLDNGQIGEIIVDPTLDRGMARNVAEAAKDIKFIPAEVDGKPVSVTLTFEYSFWTY